MKPPRLTLSPLAVRHILAAFLLSRLWTAVWVYLGAQHEDLGPLGHVWPGVTNPALHPWAAYDSQWFLSIAAHGYQPLTTAFFPLYPALLKIAGENETAMVLWGVVLSNALFLVALCLLDRLTALDYDDTIATIAVWLLAFFPVTAFFSAVYTESLFLTCLLATFLCVRRDKWLYAAMWSLLAALSRNAGPVLFLALLAEGWRARERMPRLAWLAPLAPLLAFFGMLAYSRAAFGAAGGIAAQRVFGRSLGWPWVPVWHDVVNVLTLRSADMTTLINIGATLLSFALVWCFWRRQPPSYSILIIGINLMNLTYSLHEPPYTAGAVRYMMTCFPFVQLLALSLRNVTQTRFRMVLVAAMVLFLGAMMSFIFGVRAFVA